jgi:hypothetical protein
VASASKKALNSCLDDPEAVSALLGHSPAQAAILAKAYALAKKKSEPIDDVDALYGWLYWCETNGLRKDAAALSEMATAILGLPDSPPRERPAGKSKARAVGFRPERHAEFTFFPTPEFKRACGCDHDDVGIFCDADETLLLEQIARERKGARLRIRIAEGACEIVAKEWTELDADELPSAGKGRRGVADSVFDIARIRDEYAG